MNLHKIMRLNYLREKVFAKQLKSDALESLTLLKQWHNEYENE